MEERLKNIKAFLFDVDGVFTDGGLLADLQGEFYRTFNSKDGFAVRMAVMHGYHVGIITGGRSESIRKRFLACGFQYEDIYLNARNKMVDFEDFCSKHGLKPEEVMYLGDDIPDIPVMVACGCGAWNGCNGDSRRAKVGDRGEGDYRWNCDRNASGRCAAYR